MHRCPTAYAAKRANAFVSIGRVSCTHFSQCCNCPCHLVFEKNSRIVRNLESGHPCSYCVRLFLRFQAGRSLLAIRKKSLLRSARGQFEGQEEAPSANPCTVFVAGGRRDGFEWHVSTVNIPEIVASRLRNLSALTESIDAPKTTSRPAGCPCVGHILCRTFVTGQASIVNIAVSWPCLSFLWRRAAVNRKGKEKMA